MGLFDKFRKKVRNISKETDTEELTEPEPLEINNERIPMTAPVTSFIDKNEQNMIFYILGEKNIEDLPTPDNRNVKLEKFNLNKCAVISFSWLANKERINKYENIKKEVEVFIEDINSEYKSIEKEFGKEVAD